VTPASTTTTTSVPKPNFNAATSACLKAAQSAYKLCTVTELPAACRIDYDAAIEDCFVIPDGVSCATTCVVTRRTCEDPIQATEKTCSSDCTKTRSAALKLCAPADTACAGAAQAAYSACKKACGDAAAAPLATCKSAFDACLPGCPNL
jgi:hypothetical protein